MTIAVFVPGDPKGQPRPRAFARNGRASVYDPHTAEGWKSQIARALEGKLPEHATIGPVVVSMDFRFARPKGHFGKRGLRDAAPRWHHGKPDLDNLAKAVLDALSILRVWEDDRQVIELVLAKRWAEPGEGPGMVLEVVTRESAAATEPAAQEG